MTLNPFLNLSVIKRRNGSRLNQRQLYGERKKYNDNNNKTKVIM